MTEKPDNVDEFLDLLDQARDEAEARQSAYLARAEHKAQAIAAQLTETLLTPEMRAAGMRFEWGPSEPEAAGTLDP
jgi:hypothetical protein